MMFAAFEKHQYYNIKDLVRITKQPVVSNLLKFCSALPNYSFFAFLQITLCPLTFFFQTYLKEILKEVCDYNIKNPHKNMWELKPEYRHYKDDQPPTEDKADKSDDDDSD